ncbi:MAG TPA: hypothetical protein PKD83_07360 [Ignavibacteria bacterium]|nr:hypothetical protein [Ignavibacteria bacterium]
METIQIPLSEYNTLKEELKLLKDSQLLLKINRLLDIMYQEKYGLYLGNYTADLQEYSVNEIYKDSTNAWDNL